MKNILIIAASSTIGQAIAQEARNQQYNLILTARNLDKLKDFELAQKHILDITDTFNQDEIIKLLPDLDAVIFCQSTSKKVACKNIEIDDIDQVMDVNFTYPIIFVSKIIKKKILKENCSLVFLTSKENVNIKALNGLYAASKAAICTYAKTLAMELKDKNIRVNTLSYSEIAPENILSNNDEFLENFSQETLLENLITSPEDIAEMAMYLISKKSGKITGEDFCL